MTIAKITEMTIEKITEGDLSASNDIEISVTVTQGGDALSGKLVTFEFTDTERGTFSPETGSIATDSDGIAKIIVKATSVGGGVEVTANYSTATPVSIAFNSLGDADDGDDAS